MYEKRIDKARDVNGLAEELAHFETSTEVQPHINTFFSSRLDLPTAPKYALGTPFD